MQQHMTMRSPGHRSVEPAFSRCVIRSGSASVASIGQHLPSDMQLELDAFLALRARLSRSNR